MESCLGKHQAQFLCLSQLPLLEHPQKFRSKGSMNYEDLMTFLIFLPQLYTNIFDQLCESTYQKQAGLFMLLHYVKRGMYLFNFYPNEALSLRSFHSCVTPCRSEFSY